MQNSGKFSSHTKDFRLRAFALHGWIGLAFSLYLFVLFLTGVLIVFDKEIDRFLARPIADGSGPVAGFGEAFDHLTDALPDAKVTQIGLEKGGWTIAYRIDGERYFGWVDNDNGSISSLSTRASFQRVIRDFHAHLLTGHGLARIAVTSMGLILLFQIASGLWTYRRFWRGFLRWPTRDQPSRAWRGTLHRVVALWSLPVLTISALTGLVFMADAFGFYPDEPKAIQISTRAQALPTAFDGKDVEAAIAAAVLTMPDLKPTAVDLPTRPNAALKVYGETGAVLVQTKINQVLVDPSDASVLDQRHARDLNTWGRIYAAAFPLHYGDFGGTLTKIVWFIGGVAGMVLALSGGYVFAARVAGRRGGIGTVWRGMPILFRIGLIVAGLLAIGMYLVRYA